VGGRYFSDTQEASGKEEIPGISESHSSEIKRESPVVKKGFVRRI
jgi:hypothetical protein